MTILPPFYVHNIHSNDISFFGATDPLRLAETYGTPLYVYSENVLRTRCREMKNLVRYDNFRMNYSAKANTNLSMLRIIREEGFLVDAMSPGEIFVELKAGYRPEEILYICNNVADDEMLYAIQAGVTTSVDSLSQLDRYGRLDSGGKVAIRINPGVGAGHHAKVVTGGKNTKFGIDPDSRDEIRSILRRHNLRLAGVNQHIGSLFLTPDAYIEAAQFLLSFANHFPELEFIDFGGGFGIPYHKEEGGGRLDLQALGNRLQQLIDNWTSAAQRRPIIKIEPGRYIVAESGILLGSVHSIKSNGPTTYIGTDIGFNVLARPIMYDAHHDIEVYGAAARKISTPAPVTIVGNICETGDIIAKDRVLSAMREGDIIGVLDAGAYGMVMSSNYNCRLRPAEVLITASGEPKLIRNRDVMEDLVRHFPA